MTRAAPVLEPWQDVVRFPDAARRLGIPQRELLECMGRGEITGLNVPGEGQICFSQSELLALRRRRWRDARDPAHQCVVYVVGYGPYVKIGITRRLNDRLAKMQTHAPEKLAVYGQIQGAEAEEQALHRRFRAYRLNGEWFAKSPEIAAWIAEGCPL